MLMNTTGINDPWCKLLEKQKRGRKPKESGQENKITLDDRPSTFQLESMAIRGQKPSRQ